MSSSHNRSSMNPNRGSNGDGQVRLVGIKPGTLTVHSGIPSSSFAAEQYLTLAVRLEERISTVERDRAFLVSVTSPEPAAGKTLTSLNLALTLGKMSKRRVLLIECDLRRPTLFEFLDFDSLPLPPGLADILVGDAQFSDAIRSVRGTGLDLVGAGSRSKLENLIADRRLAEALRGPRLLYDIVILDSPPLPLASGRSLANLAQGVLLVVRAGQTRRGDIKGALSSIDPDKVLGMVLNGVRRSRLRSSAYGSYAYYDRDETETFSKAKASGRADQVDGTFPRDFSMGKVRDSDEGS